MEEGRSRGGRKRRRRRDDREGREEGERKGRERGKLAYSAHSSGGSGAWYKLGVGAGQGHKHHMIKL